MECMCRTKGTIQGTARVVRSLACFRRELAIRTVRREFCPELSKWVRRCVLHTLGPESFRGKCSEAGVFLERAVRLLPSRKQVVGDYL